MGANRISTERTLETAGCADHAVATAGIECRKDVDVIDETPRAYKSIEDVMSAQKDLVTVVATLHHVLCVKG